MVEEAPLRQGEHGLVPTGTGWFVVNARDTPWIERKGRPQAYFAMNLAPGPKTRLADRAEIGRAILSEAGVL